MPTDEKLPTGIVLDEFGVPWRVALEGEPSGIAFGIVPTPPDEPIIVPPAPTET